MLRYHSPEYADEYATYYIITYYTRICNIPSDVYIYECVLNYGCDTIVNLGISP